MTTALRLEYPGGSLDLDDTDNNGFAISDVDLGFPPVRPVSSPLPNQDGTFDQTKNFDARTVTLTGALVPTFDGTKSRSKVFDSLVPYLTPGIGATFVYCLDDDMTERRLDYQYPTQLGNPINHPKNATNFTVQLVCPNPIAYEQEINEVDIPFATLSSSGVGFPFTFPLTFPTGGFVGGDATVVSGGTYPTWPTLRIFGPCENPAIYWLDPTTDEPLDIQVVFQSLTVNDGDYVEVDTRAKTALLNGLPASSVYNFLDFNATTWGQLQPGTNLLRFTPDTASGACICQVRWHDSFL